MRPRYVVCQLRVSIFFAPIATSVAHGCVKVIALIVVILSEFCPMRKITGGGDHIAERRDLQPVPCI